MRGILSGLIFAATFAGVTGSASAEDALGRGDMLSGILRLVHIKQPNGTDMQAYQLVSKPRQVTAADDFCANPEASISICSRKPSPTA